MEWGLEAVVMGANYSNPTTPIEWFELRVEDSEYGFSPPSSFSFDDDFLQGGKWFGDLEEVYKPFYPGFQSSRPVIDQEMRGFEGREESPAKSPVAATTDAAPLITKYKRRKNQQKRVVEHVTTDAVPSDKWAWRKYGQKPIKGSPYPRSYYRCSSSRECLARKQVERSISDPNLFTISYTEEHNHEQPTRRNALAGSTRPSKLSTTNIIKNNSPAAESPINSSSSGDEGKIVNLSSGGVGGGFGDEKFSFLGFEEMDWNFIR